MFDYKNVVTILKVNVVIDLMEFCVCFKEEFRD